MYDSVASSIEQFGETFTTLSLAPAWLLLPKGSLASGEVGGRNTW